jgi:hypothetical protein
MRGNQNSDLKPHNAWGIPAHVPEHQPKRISTAPTAQLAADFTPLTNKKGFQALTGMNSFYIDNKHFGNQKLVYGQQNKGTFKKFGGPQQIYNPSSANKMNSQAIK